MRDTKASRTAIWVAACRAGLGVKLPPGVKLCDDPYGMLFLGWPTKGLRGVPTRLLGRALLYEPQVRKLLLWMQLRTRYLDDTLLKFVRGGGRQVVILGAGCDCRAIRFASELADCAVFEVDHPATQAYKRDVLARGNVPPSRAKYFAFDFEKQPMGTLPVLLAAAGLDLAKPTITIWEGVTMYLTEPAIEASVAAIHAYSGPGSQLAFTYFDLAMQRKKNLSTRLMMAAVRRAGEPWKFGWDFDKLGEWLRPRNFELTENVSEQGLARRYFPKKLADRFQMPGRRIGLATRI